MTEAEWLASGDPAAMADVVLGRPRASPRVLRLYTAAFWAWQSHRLEIPEDRARLLGRAALVGEWAETGAAPPEVADRHLFIGFDPDPKNAFRSTAGAPGGWKNGQPAVERAVWLLREVFGNPFATRRKRKGDPRRGSMFHASWRTATVLTLANQMYASRDFSAMPILADALQDAGCDNDDILSHCRTEKEHVRGCWVVDLVLKKG
jgi:hypothetical protein